MMPQASSRLSWLGSALLPDPPFLRQLPRFCSVCGTRGPVVFPTHACELRLPFSALRGPAKLQLHAAVRVPSRGMSNLAAAHAHPISIYAHAQSNAHYVAHVRLYVSSYGPPDRRQEEAREEDRDCYSSYWCHQGSR